MSHRLRNASSLTQGTPAQPGQVALRLWAALADLAQGTELGPTNLRVAGLSPSQGTCLGCGAGSPLKKCRKEPHIDVSLFLPSPLKIKSFKKIKDFRQSPGTIFPSSLLPGRACTLRLSQRPPRHQQQPLTPTASPQKKTPSRNFLFNSCVFVTTF